jgi:hypothetical protein
MAKAILLDATNRKITEVDLPDVGSDGRYSDWLEAAYKHLGVRTIAAWRSLPNGDVIYVDDEALLKERNSQTPWFAMHEMGAPVCGNALITGEEGPEGETSSAKSTIQEIEDRTVMLTENLVAKWVDTLPETPYRVTMTTAGEPTQVLTEFKRLYRISECPRLWASPHAAPAAIIAPRTYPDQRAS